MEKNLSLLNFISSHFYDTPETIEIKNYAKKLKQIDDFKNLKINLVQFRDSDTLKKNLKLYNPFKELMTKTISVFPTNIRKLGAYNNLTKHINIYIDNQIKYGKLAAIRINLSKRKIQLINDPNFLNKTCTKILATMYHEKKHKLQETNKDNSFDSIMYQIESNLKASYYGMGKYLTQHDKWFLEIDANNYGIDKALEYYENNPQDKHGDISYLLSLKKMYTYDKKAYNFDEFFSTYNIYREQIPFYSKARRILSNVFLKDRTMAWHKVLYGDKKRLKTMEEILNNPLTNEIDPKFINNVITSRYLNLRTDYKNITDETKTKLLTAFNHKLSKTYYDTEQLLKIITAESDFYKRRYKNDLNRMKKDMEYYKNRIELLTNLLYENNNKRNIR